uniref:Uncharacterized protein n=1 Tax=Parascaris univalens TaxID=6257 RepID=A0A914ZWG1_PARUN
MTTFKHAFRSDLAIATSSCPLHFSPSSHLSHCCLAAARLQVVCRNRQDVCLEKPAQKQSVQLENELIPSSSFLFFLILLLSFLSLRLLSPCFPAIPWKMRCRITLIISIPTLRKKYVVW